MFVVTNYLSCNYGFQVPPTSPVLHSWVSALRREWESRKTPGKMPHQTLIMLMFYNRLRRGQLRSH